MTTGRINQVVNYRGRDGGRSGRSATPRVNAAQPTAGALLAPSQHTPEGAGGLARRPRVASEDTTPAAPVFRRATVATQVPRPSCLLPLSVRKLPHSQRFERARSRRSEEDARGVDLSDGQRATFRRRYVCSLDDGQWGAAEATLPRSQPDHDRSVQLL
jgi:hypothetical protein